MKTAEEILRDKTPSSLFRRGECHIGHALDAMEEYALEAIKNDRGRIKENSEDLICFFGEDMYGNPQFTIGGKALEELKIELP